MEITVDNGRFAPNNTFRVTRVVNGTSAVTHVGMDLSGLHGEWAGDCPVLSSNFRDDRLGLLYGTVLGREIAALVRVGGLAGRCNSGGTMGGVDFGTGSNRVLNFLKPGNTNGSAAVGVVANCLSSASNRTVVGNVSVLRSPVGTGGRVNCLPRLPPLCLSVAMERCLCFVCSLGNYALPQGARLGRVYRLIGVSGIFSEVVGGLSGNCHRHMNLTRTLINGPGILILSRPAMNLSPGRVVRVEALVGGLNGGRAMVLSDRVLDRIRTIYSEVMVVGRNGVITSSATSGLSGALSTSRGLVTHVSKPGSRIVGLVCAVPNIRAIITSVRHRGNI